jgi:hypothetical protein
MLAGVGLAGVGRAKAARRGRVGGAGARAGCEGATGRL